MKNVVQAFHTIPHHRDDLEEDRLQKIISKKKSNTDTDFKFKLQIKGDRKTKQSNDPLGP